MKIFQTKIGRVRSRSGAELKLLAQPTDPNRGYIEARIRACLDGQGQDLAGFAFVAWGSTGESVAELVCNERNNLPPSLVPEFVKLRLLTERTHEVAREEIERSWGASR